MLNRRTAQCHSCGNRYVLSIGVGLAPEQRLAWPCPVCGVPQHAHLTVDYRDITFDLKSHDFDQLESIDFEGLQGVNVYAELPVHVSSKGVGLRDGGSAFLKLMQYMGGEAFYAMTQRKDDMQRQHSTVLPMVRREAGHYVNEKWEALFRQLKKDGVLQLPGLGDVHPCYSYVRALNMVFVPLLDAPQMQGITDEFVAMMEDCARNHQTAFDAALHDMFHSQGFRLIRQRVIGTVFRLFDAYDAVLAGLIFESFTEDAKSKEAEFRLYRDDFDQLKALYLDVFEGMNHMVLYVGMLLNLSKRSDVRAWANGRKQSYSKAKDTTAETREFVLDELPACKALVGRANRSLRNDIGHYSVHLDIGTGRLVLADGSTKNLLEFHQDLLYVARLAYVLVVFVEKITLYHELRVVKNKFKGWK